MFSVQNNNLFEMPIRLFALFIVGLCLLAACDDTAEKNRAALAGHWELTKALRNQRETGVLVGIYFDFEGDGKMTTNLPVAPETPVTTDYEVTQKEIIQKLPLPLTYEIQSLDDSTLVLKMEMRSIPFELYLQRAEKPAPLPEFIPEQDSSSLLDSSDGQYRR